MDDVNCHKPGILLVVYLFVIMSYDYDGSVLGTCMFHDTQNLAQEDRFHIPVPDLLSPMCKNRVLHRIYITMLILSSY